PSRPAESFKAARVKAKLIAPKGTSGITESPRNIVLVGIARLNEHDHGVNFGHSVSKPVVVKDKPVDQDNTVAFFRSQSHPLVDNDGSLFWRGEGEEFSLVSSRFHGRQHEPCLDS